MPFTETALGVAVTAITDEHLFTFLLSSPFTARTIVLERGQREQVISDLNLATMMSVAFSVGYAALLRNVWTAIFGVGFAIFMRQVYKSRGHL